MTWRFAKAMPEKPHWCVVERDSGGPLFDGFLAHLDAAGKVCNYKGYPYQCVTVDDDDYWTTLSEEAGAMINRKPRRPGRPGPRMT